MPSDWQEWSQLRALSRAFLKPWEPSWPTDALSRPSFMKRLRRQATEWRDDLGYAFLSFEHQTHIMVGGLALTNLRRGVAQMATVGYWVGAPYARRGFTTAAVALVLDFAFHHLGLNRVEASCLPTNVASRGVLEKLGFQWEGLARSYLRIDGTWRDHLLYAVLKNDWRAPCTSLNRSGVAGLSGQHG